jgi:hypothetical protein
VSEGSGTLDRSRSWWTVPLADRSLLVLERAAVPMNPDDLDAYETDLELSLYREYRDVVRMFRFVVETERRFYLCNEVEVQPHEGKDLWFELHLKDAWVWDMYRPARFIKDVRVLTFRDVNIEELVHDDQDVPPFAAS